MNYIYHLTGQITWFDYNEPMTVSLDEEVAIPEKHAPSALKALLDRRDDYEFHGGLGSVDVETGGTLGATFYDQNEDQQIEIDYVKEES